MVAANDHYNSAQEQLRAGDWAGYGAEMPALQAVLEQMAQVTGVQVELPAPAAGNSNYAHRAPCGAAGGTP